MVRPLLVAGELDPGPVVYRFLKPLIRKEIASTRQDIKKAPSRHGQILGSRGWQPATEREMKSLFPELKGEGQS